MKYIVYQDGDQEMLITFPRCITHKNMAEAMEILRFDSPNSRNWHRNQGHVIAAGFIDGNECHGSSESLNIKSRGQIDTMVLRGGGSRKVQP